VFCCPLDRLPACRRVKGKKGKVRGWGLLQHYSLMAYCTLDPKFLHSSLEALHTSGVQRRQLAKEGTIDGI
jgi:hypothetical protein